MAYVDGMEPGTDVARTARPVRQGRPGVIVLIAFVVELVAIGALANEVVTKHLVTFVADHHDRFVGHLVGAFLTYQWRVTAQPGDRANEPLAHTCLDLVVFALTALLVLAVCRGPVTFARAFFGTWMAVVASTLVGQVVFDLISPPPYPPGFSHLSGAVFTGPNGFGFIAGLMLGLLTAIFAAIFAVATRRTVRPAAAYPETRRDEYGEPDWSDQTVAYPRQDYPQEYRQPYPEPYGGGYYAGQAGGGPSAAGAAGAAVGAGAGVGSGIGAGAAGADATQQLRTMAAEQPTQAAEQLTPAAEQPTPAAEQPTPAAEQPTPAPEQDIPAPESDSRNVPTQAMAPPEPTVESTPPETSPETNPEASPESTGAAPAAESTTGDHAPEETQQFPRPPDDEDLGQHPEQHEL
jgi:hypothetical protein